MTITDAFQFLVFLIVLPIVTIVALNHAGGIRSVFEQVPAANMQVIDHPNALYYLMMLILQVVFQIGMVDPANVQRMLMAKNQCQLRNKFLILSALFPAVQVVIVLLALTGIVLYPTLEGVKIVPRIVNDLLPAGTKGLAMAGLFAVSMGNIDSYLHAAGFTLVHDIVKPIFHQSGRAIDELKWTRHATIGISVFVITIGLTRVDNLYNLLFISYEFTPILVFPLWSAILSLKADKYDFYTAAGVTVVAFLVAKFLFPEELAHFIIFISLATNGIVFWVFMHCVTRDLHLLSVRQTRAT